ncbi:secretin [Mixta theicola]|uniref:Secretin n=2 Tax=Mixta theicola TaxID=1458355 RepID=A0A2K1QAC5_9GAMM|nr:secretin [Mixta theicola]
MEPGDTHVVKVQDNIDTVFISSAEVADYELIGEHGVMVYAKASGRTDLLVFDNSGNQLIKVTLVIDPLLSAVQKQISRLVPDSEVSITRLGKSYVINGTAANEEDREKIYRIVGEGIGASRTVTNKSPAAVGNADAGGGQDSGTSWLNEVSYPNVINQLQIPATNQVNVKLTVVEVTKSFTDNVGIDWGNADGLPGSFSFVKFNADKLVSLVHAISNDTVARVLAEPNLSVISGETAEFLVGGEVPVVSSSNNGISVQYKDFGIKLNVGARVNSNKRIRVTLGEEVSSISSTYTTSAGQSFPTFQTRRARTTVELADGDSFLLGGLISNNEREELAKLPFIGDVPVLGALFRNTSTERVRSELMVVATVSLVKPIGSHQVMLPDFQRTSTWARFLNFDAIDNQRSRQMAREFVEQGGFIK